MSNTLDFALDYHSRGWMPIPVPHGSKNPNRIGWQNERVTVEDLPRHFYNSSNIGLLLGKPSNGLTDIDLDCSEARALARYFLPETTMASSRTGIDEDTHKWFNAKGSKTKQFLDPMRTQTDTAMLVELRSTGSQTLVEPSIHPSGGRYFWTGPLEPVEVDTKHLTDCVSQLASAALLLRYYPQEGARHFFALALSGALLRAGWAVAGVERFIEVIAREAGDPEVEDRIKTVADTKDALDRGDNFTGLPRLSEILDEKIIKALVKWLKLKNGTHAKTKVEKQSPPLVADVEPWHEAVDGSQLLDSIASLFRRFLSADLPCYITLSLWVIYSHCFEAFEISPLLLLSSPTKRSGKTTTLTLLSGIVRRPVPAANITAATMFRVVQAVQPTLLVDEADSFLRDNEELRGVINSGHTRSMSVILRCAGESYEVKPFNTFSPKVLAMIGKPPGTILDRSVRLPLKRAPHNAKLELVRLDRLSELKSLQRKAARWAKDQLKALRDSDPEVPPAIRSARDRDNWRPLLAIADAAGGEWPDKARAAAIELCGGSDEGDSVGEMLIKDIYTFFEAEDYLRVKSEIIVEHLRTIEDRPWVEFGRQQKPLTTNGLATLLRPFDVRPCQWRNGVKVERGYERAAFADVFDRFCFSVDADSVQSVQPYETNSLQECAVGTKEISVPSENLCNHSKTKPCTECTELNTPEREEKRFCSDCGGELESLDVGNTCIFCRLTEPLFAEVRQ